MQWKEAMTLTSGVKDPDKNRLEEPASEAEKQQELKELLEFIMEAVVKTEGPETPHLNADDISFIDDAKGRLREEIPRDIDFLLEEIRTPRSRDKFLSMINEALLSAYVLGNYSAPSKSIWELYGSQHRRRLSSKAREARASTTRDRQKELKAAIKHAADKENKRLAGSEKFARIIRPEVLAYLGSNEDESGWPSVGTIKAAVRKLMKD